MFRAVECNGEFAVKNNLLNAVLISVLAAGLAAYGNVPTFPRSVPPGKHLPPPQRGALRIRLWQTGTGTIPRNRHVSYSRQRLHQLEVAARVNRLARRSVYE